MGSCSSSVTGTTSRMRLILILGVAVPLSVTSTGVKRIRNLKRDVTGDPHNEQFCVDISFYTPVQWVTENVEECSTTFVKKCEHKKQNVCREVTETMCEVVPYTECSMS